MEVVHHRLLHHHPPFSSSSSSSSSSSNSSPPTITTSSLPHLPLTSSSSLLTLLPSPTSHHLPPLYATPPKCRVPWGPVKSSSGRSCVGSCSLSRSGRHGLMLQKPAKLGNIIMRVGGDPPPEGSSGEEPPETLFMRELKRRGMTSSISSEDKDPASSTETATLEGSSVDIGNDKRGMDGSTVNSTTPWKDERDIKNQRERSMVLNSEGLDGLIPRAQELLKLGSSFFVAFWPFIFASLAAFIALYIYFGTSFIHTGSQTYHPPYVDPFKLLDEDALPPELGPSSVPFLQ